MLLSDKNKNMLITEMKTEKVVLYERMHAHTKLKRGCDVIFAKLRRCRSFKTNRL